MRKHGVTLVELAITMVLCTILLLVMTVQFVASQNFLAVVNNQITASKEATIAIKHMKRTLRFAFSSTSTTPPGYVPSDMTCILTATIEGVPSHLTEFTANTKIQYIFSSISTDKNLTYKFGGNNPVLIAQYVKSFTVDLSVPKEIKINLVIQKGNQTVPVSTTIYTLPN